MQQARFSLTEEQIQFLTQYSQYGFRDRSELVRTALERLRAELVQKDLERSAELYAQLYEQDEESKAWVEDALNGWPE